MADIRTLEIGGVARIRSMFAECGEDVETWDRCNRSNSCKFNAERSRRTEKKDWRNHSRVRAITVKEKDRIKR